MTERDPNQPTPDESVGARPGPTPTTDDTPTQTWRPPAPAMPAVEETSAERAAAAPAERVRGAQAGRLRWGIALLVTVVVVAIGAAAVVLLTGQSAPSSLVGYAPANSVVYGELRFDLPGDQRQKLGQFLSKFPGFKDQANLATKYDEVLDRFMLAITSNQQDYTNNIKPWFGGELGFSVGQLPTSASTVESDFRYLVLVSVTDAAKARAWMDGVLGPGTTTADHRGTQLVLSTQGSNTVATGIHGKVMLLGDEASVRAAIDTNGAGELAKSDRFASAHGSVRGDSLGYFYIDFTSYLDWFTTFAESVPDGADLGFTFDQAYRDLLPEWGMFRVQARGDSIAMEVVTPHVESTIKWANRAGTLAPHLPPSTIFLADGHDFGESIMQTIDVYRNNPSTKEAMAQIDQAVGLLGGWEGIVGWIRDGGLALTRDGDRVDGGLVFSPNDRAKGERLLATLRSYAVIGGGQTGLHIEVRDEPYAGTTISVIDFGEWRDIAAMGRGVAPSDFPLEGRFELAYAATDDILVIAIGDSFVKAVLDAKPGSSLADDGRYRSLIDRVGAQNVGSVYLDIDAVREMIEKLFKEADPSGFATYETEYKPYLEPLDAYIQASTIDGDRDRMVGLVVVE